MDSVNDNTKAAVKLTRTDAVKLVAAELSLLVAGGVSGCEARVIEAREAFRAWACAVALQCHSDAVMEALDAVGGEPEMVHSVCKYRVYADGSDSGDTVQVVVSDHQQSYEARMRLVLTIGMTPEGDRLRAAWLLAMVDLGAAQDRDLRVGAMNKEAREILIKSALDSSDEGVNVVKAIRALAAALKSKA